MYRVFHLVEESFFVDSAIRVALKKFTLAELLIWCQQTVFRDQMNHSVLFLALNP